MMDNYSEQIVKKRVNPAKFTFLILYFVFAFIFILLTVYLSQFFDWMIPLALLIIGFGWYGGWYLWSHKGIEYEYIVVQGEMTVDKIIGMKKRKRMLKFDVKSVDTPDEAYKNNIGQYGRFDGAAKYIDPREE